MEISNRRAREWAYLTQANGRYSLSIGFRDCSKDRYVPNGKDLIISTSPGYSTSIGPLNLEDLKALRKAVRLAIRNYNDNREVQI